MKLKSVFYALILIIILASIAAHAFYLPDTGQTTCYRDVSPYDEIPCTGTGQDGEYNINPMSFTDHGDGTVTDNNTGLMWQRCNPGQNNDSECSGTASLHNWYEASGTYEATYNPGITDVCGNLIVGGYSDWRLPDVYELQGIVNYGKIYPALDTTYFPNAASMYQWTITTDASESSYAWYVVFSSGRVKDHRPKTLTGPVRCVRGGQSSQYFTNNGNGTVTDNRTGLVWQQEDDNQLRTWVQTLTYCEDLSIPPHNDWRLPNIKELRSLVENTPYSPRIDTTYFPNTNGKYWSSTTCLKELSSAWYVSFFTGYVPFSYKTSHAYVMCVSCGQSGGNCNGQVDGVTISGYVSDSGGTGISGVTMSGDSCSVTDASGYYSCTAGSNWSGTITPSADCYSFSPANMSYSNVTTDQTDQNYTGTSTCSGTPEITSPVPGSTLSGSTETFTWTGEGTAVTEWWLWIGTSQGKSNIHNSGSLSSTSTTVSGLPADGRQVYVRLWFWDNTGSWQYIDYQYTAFTGSGGGSPPEMTTPVPDSTLSGSSETFTWTANGTAVSQWWLYVGSNTGSSNIANSGSLGTSTSSYTVNNLPTNGSQVYVRLWYNTGSWQYVDFQYTAFTGSGGGSEPEMTSPVPGSTLSSASETFTWTANGTAVSQWWLWIGSSTGSSNIANSSSLGTSTSSYTVNNLPTNGSQVYVRLWYNTGSWQYVDFEYTAFTGSGGGSEPEMTSPLPGSTLSGSTETFMWTANGTAVSQWWLWVGSSMGSSNISTSGSLGGSNTSYTVNGLPTDGSQVYVRLWYNVGTWQYMDFQYTAW